MHEPGSDLRDGGPQDAEDGDGDGQPDRRVCPLPSERDAARTEQDSERHGLSIVYSLFDDHLSELIDQAIYHSEHLRVGITDRSEQLNAVAGP